ncbi:thiamine pyrophosphate-binding protein [Tropicibacter naphthalenivorans]|uniref:Acetolactate synthase isozyme 2 large subunit n=1 Tax=Tropicibacter naphthalenivorans TaxID=441103 RepID=A0A0P1G3U0_9RHOB|nr:thiamine pyrophosphate-binding protein [Tropicibacter naphthalenivorans]CUH76333.1 Acetolactate synthase isozyme 2 large subunit [Tropicibacter naphthalenivorans]SMC67783.1 acetolactate synthase, large subunit [Tropicibacter naphthalenivorans]
MTQRTGGQILVDQLKIQGVKTVSCVPGESYLAVLDALYDSGIDVTICRQEGGAAIMAEAQGKLTGRPGVCFVTRGPGATNASAGVHIAKQDSTPMILFVGQIARWMRGREAFQEVDYKQTFGDLAKWAVEIDDPARLSEIVSRAFHVAMNGRPGPVVVALPEDMLTEASETQDAAAAQVFAPVPSQPDMARALEMLTDAQRPLVIAGGSRWTAQAVDDLVALCETMSLPVAVSFRRQSYFPSDHPNFVGDLGVGGDPALVAYATSADVVLMLGGRFSEMPSQGYTAMDIPVPQQQLIHVHPDTSELGRVYQPTLGIACAVPEFLASARAQAPKTVPRAELIASLRAALDKRRTIPAQPVGDLALGEVMAFLNDALPDDTVICNGAGNYATWVHRFYQFTKFGTQAAPTSGSMGYGVPAAVGAARLGRRAVAFAGDGCFLMHGQEFATAVQYDLPILVIVIDNGMYGTIRMHQEREYPGRVSGTQLKNPDFAAYARAFGGHGERVEKTADFAPAYDRAMASGKPAIIHCLIDPESLTVDRTLSQIRAAAQG